MYEIAKATRNRFVSFWSRVFLGLLSAYFTFENRSDTPVGYLVPTHFKVHFVFALNVFFLFLVLHMLGWFIANRVDACASEPELT